MQHIKERFDEQIAWLKEVRDAKENVLKCTPVVTPMEVGQVLVWIVRVTAREMRCM